MNWIKKIPKTLTKPTVFIPRNYNINLFLTPATTDEIGIIIDKLKECATGWDNIPSKIIKDSKEILKPTLMHIINNSLISGIFPTELKLANVVPIFKTGSTEEITNYRPVSLLTTFSKIYEKNFYNRLLKFLKDQNILFISQFGFLENSSTYMAIISLLDKIIEALDSGRVAIGIFIDFSKAFDTVNHSILLDKLDHYGIRGIAKQWVDSYLRDRQLYCTYLDSKSSMQTMKCGVPQGSILGPLLFLIYINDMGGIFTKFTPILFTDDSNLVATGRNIKEIEEIANQELPILLDWLQGNRLSINVKKTHIMNFRNHNNNKNAPNPTIKINNEIIDMITETKLTENVCPYSHK